MASGCRDKKRMAEINKGTRFSGEKAVEAGKKGAAVSATVRKQHALFRDAFKEHMTPERMEKIFDALCQKAENGDVQAAAFLRDTMGEKPVEKMEQTISEIAFRIEGVSEEEADAISG